MAPATSSSVHSAVVGSHVDLVPIRTALLSVFDKSDILPLARQLVERYHVQLISTGGTYAALQEAGIAVRTVEEFTHSPEILHGRVKTLHPIIHGGLLAVRGNPEDEHDMRTHQITPIDLVIVNLYPFNKAIQSDPNNVPRAIENIDIGGPSMIRSSAKNNAYVAVVTSPTQYPALLAELNTNNGSLSSVTRFMLAAHAFQTTAAYDAAIANYLLTKSEDKHAHNA